MNERISKIINHPARLPVGVGIGSFAAGIGLGYILGQRKRKGPMIFEHKMGVPDTGVVLTPDEYKEVVEARETVEELLAEDIAEPEDDMAAQLERAMTGGDREPRLDLPERVKKNIFAHTDEEWDREEEIKSRTPEEPYVIHKDEFYADEMDFTQTTLTYYAGDNIMTDEEDVPIYNHENITGPLKWGHGSGDPNTFHVRNEKRKAEYEIIRHEGLYSVEILALEIEDNARESDIQHFRVGKFRPD